MHLGACARLLERAGYIERVSVYDNADDLASGTPNTLVRLTGDSVAPHQLVIDDNALQQRKQLELQKIRRMVGYANAAMPTPENAGVFWRAVGQTQLRVLRQLPR